MSEPTCSVAANGRTAYSCFSAEKLRKLAELYNQSNEDPIDLRQHGGGSTAGSSQHKYLWQELNKRLSSKCQNEWCWLKQDFVEQTNDEDLKRYTFMPANPARGQNSWLSTSNLEEVMSHYERRYPDFEFVGALPIDFGQDILNMSVADAYRQGTRLIGFIFNMDPSDKRGSHWVSMVVNMRISPPEICYFDSYGICPPPKEIIILVKSLRQWRIGGQSFVYKCNNLRHQYASSECGVYCLYFLTQTIQGKSFEEINRKIIKDEQMTKERVKTFFSPVKDK